MTLWDSYTRAAATSNRPLSSLLREATRLRLSQLRFGFSEYIDFRLFDGDLSWHDKQSFGGLRAQAILEELPIDDYSRLLSLDKVTMYALLAGFHLPIPRPRATYRLQRPSLLPSLQTPEELAQFLAQSANASVYLKRAFGSYGHGNLLVKQVDGEHVLLSTGKKEPLSQFCASLDDGRTLG
jgi:hypothetical protein